MAAIITQPEKFKGPLTSVDTASSSSNSDDESGSKTQIDYRKITRKLDRRIIGVLGMMIMIEFLDRVGLGFARIAGIDEELKLNVGYRFSLVILVANVAATLVQVPLMFLGHRFHPPYAIGTCALGWAATLLGIAFARRWTDLLPCRVVAGAVGGVISQVIHVLIQTWYPRYEMARRFAWLAVLVWLSKAVGGITAFGITKMNGVGGLAGWRWIYIWSGILTLIAAAVAYVYTVGYADTPSWQGLVSSFLSSEEHQIVVNRLDQDRGDGEREDLNFTKVLRCACDFKFWLFGFMSMALSSILTSLAIFSPMIMHHDFGFDAGKSQALYAPPYVFTAVLLILVSEISDRTHYRGGIIILCVLLSIIGLVLIGFTTLVSVRYLGLFFANGGLGATAPLLSAFLANNIRGFWKRSFGTAFMVAFAGIGGIAGSLIFRSQDAPRYLPGLVTSIVLAFVIIAIVGILDLCFYFANHKQEKEGKILEGLEGFRYTY